MSMASAALANFVRDHLSDEEILELVRAWLVREVPASRPKLQLDAEAAAIVLGSIQGGPPPDEAMMGLVRKRLG